MKILVLASILSLSSAGIAQTNTPIQGTIPIGDVSDLEEVLAAKITLQEAAQFALDFEPGIIYEVELDEINDFLVFDVRMYDSNNKRLRVIVDAGDGSILRP